MKRLGFLSTIIAFVLVSCGSPAPITPTPDSAFQTSVAGGPTITPVPFVTTTPTVSNGSGNGVVDFTPCTCLKVITGTYKGNGKFIVEGYDTDNNKTGLIFNGLDDYKGTQLILLDASLRTTHLQVTAAGDWKIEINYLGMGTTILQAPFTYKGRDDDFIGIDNRDKGDLLLKFSTEQKGKIMISMLTQDEAGKWKLVVNETGPAQGSAILPQGILGININGPSSWEISVTEK